MSNELPHVVKEREHYEQMVQKFTKEAHKVEQISAEAIWSAEHNPAVYESCSGSIGLFRSREGAINCVIRSMINALDEWIDLYGDSDFYNEQSTRRFDEYSHWHIESVEVKP